MTVGPNVGVTWRDDSVATAQTITVDGIAALTTAGLTIQNTTPALVGAQVQRAPSFWQYGTGWDTDDAVSRVFGMGWQMRPVAGAVVSGALHLMRDVAGTIADAGVAVNSTGAFIYDAATVTDGKQRIAHATAFLVGKDSDGINQRVLFDWGISAGGDSIGIGDSAGGITDIRFFAGSNALRFRGVTGAITNLGTSDMLFHAADNSSAGAGQTAGVVGQRKSSGAVTAVGGMGFVQGGDHDGTGSALVCAAGIGKVGGGSATGSGGSGTYIGGSVWVAPGTGATRNGNTYIGRSDPTSFNWQAMANGIAIQVADVAPTGNPTGAFYLYMDPGDNALKARSPAGTITTVGAA